MKVALNETQGFNERYHTTGDIAPEGVEKLVEKIGAQLGAVEEVIDFGKKYQGIVVAKVVSCEPHPGADKLKLCKIDDAGTIKSVERDENNLVQVVCGAPNVREGLLVAWLPPGVTIPSTFDKETVVLEAKEIRGEVSNGMLASCKELNLSDDHSGILELPEDKAKPGDDFAKTFGLDDYIIDIENKMFTHRPDLFGFLGVARELAGIQGMPFKSPEWYVNPKTLDIESEELKLEVKNELPELVPRFTAITMRDVKVGPSPLWLQILLSKLGMKPINNIVDCTNYCMYLTAQPLHAYDYDKLAKGNTQKGISIEVRKSRKGDKLKLLSGKEITFDNEAAILITSGDKPVGIGGVMGGSGTEVDQNTKNIVIECANFDMYSIRRTSMQHGLFTDAVTRFTKGQSPLQTTAVLAKIIDEIHQSAGGKIASDVIDITSRQSLVVSRQVKVSPNFINSRLGFGLNGQEIAELLLNVEFEITGDLGPATSDSEFAVQIPFWRTDIEIPEDIVEEVGRLRGYDSVPLALPRRSAFPVGPDLLLGFKQQLRRVLAQLGANETLNYSFVNASLLEKVGQNKNSAFKIANALSPDLQYYRLSLSPSLLEKVHMNIKAGYDRFALFEIGKSHIKEFKTDDLPHEFERVALVFAGTTKESHSSAYYEAKNYLTHLLEALGIEPFSVTLEPLDPQVNDQATTYYQPGRAATIKIADKIIGRIGEYKPSVARALKLPDQSAGFELDTLTLLEYADSKPSYQPLSKYPSLSQDICLEVAAEITYGELTRALEEALKNNIENEARFSLTPLDIYQTQKLKGHKRITFRVTVTSFTRTLKESEVTDLLDKAANQLAGSLGAVRI